MNLFHWLTAAAAAVTLGHKHFPTIPYVYKHFIQIIFITCISNFRSMLVDMPSDTISNGNILNKYIRFSFHHCFCHSIEYTNQTLFAQRMQKELEIKKWLWLRMNITQPNFPVEEKNMGKLKKRKWANIERHITSFDHKLKHCVPQLQWNGWYCFYWLDGFFSCLLLFLVHCTVNVKRMCRVKISWGKRETNNIFPFIKESHLVLFHCVELEGQNEYIFQ